MSSEEIVVRVNDLGKCYHVYEHPQDRLKQFVLPRLHRWIGKPAKRYFREFWALRNASFEIKKGETVGIVGRNGSGKSTLLQMICGTLTPTHGTVNIEGRIAALLELGAGFNPEFTGRENVYMNGAVLGLSRAEINERFEDIVAFAEIGEFIEQPVKMYSSGMFVRLAFATAINVDPDVLIIDEALSVGDEAFQRKCFARIENLKRLGTTILFVSHSGGTVVEFCDRAILLDSGEMLLCGASKAVVSRYQKLIYAPPDAAHRLREEYRALGGIGIQSASDPATELKPRVFESQSAAAEDKPTVMYDPHMRSPQVVEYERRGAEIIDPHIESLDGGRVNLLVHGEEYIFTYRVRFERTFSQVQLGMLIRSISGLELGGGVYPSLSGYLEFVEPGSELSARFHFRCLLNPAVYFLNAGVMGEVDGVYSYLDRKVDVVMFRVQPNRIQVATALVDFDIVAEIVGPTQAFE